MKKNLATKIILIVVLVVALVLISAFSYLIFNIRTNDINNAYINTESLANQNAMEIKAELEQANSTALILNQAISAFESFPVEKRREILNGIIANIADNNDNIIGAWAIFEPNTLDGLDTEYINAPGHDQTGRFIPYWVKGDNGLELAANVDYDIPGSGDYYLVAFKQGKEIFQEPSLYEVSGKEVLMASFCIPIRNSLGKVIGVSGVDITLDTLNQFQFNNGSYSSTQTSFYSNSGMVVIHNNSDLVGKYLNDAISDLDTADDMMDAITEGTTYIGQSISEVTGNKCLRVMVPLIMNNTSTPWSLTMTVDMSEITADSNANMIMLIVIFLIVIAAIILAIRMAVVRLVKKPLSQLVAVAEKQAQGDISQDIIVNREDEIGTLFQSLKTVNDNMNMILSGLKKTADEVSTGAGQVSQASQELSQGATEQASAIEELSASLEEISSQTKVNASNAIEADTLTVNTRINAEQGNEKMHQLLTAMEDINVSSNNISKVIKVIEDIASQTNILALNAAIEAARAGYHGKGFAVVAEEVRNLASRSAEAAKETATMINESINKVNGGSKIAGETAEMLKRIVEEIGQVVKLINDIKTASNEQSTGISQINEGVMQVSQVIQSNTATSEQSAAASEELLSQAESMKQQVARFKLRTADKYSYKELPDQINLEEEPTQLEEEPTQLEEEPTQPTQNIEEPNSTVD